MSRTLQVCATVIALTLFGVPVAVTAEPASNLREIVTEEGLTLTVGQAIHHDVSRPLSEMVKETPWPKGYGAEDEITIRTPEFLSDLSPVETVRDPLASPPTGVPSPPALISIPAYDSDDNVTAIGMRVRPPYTNAAVGPDYIVEYVHLGWMVFDKDDPSTTMGPYPGNSFWDEFGGFCETNNAGNPSVLYDQDAGRWVFSQTVSPSNPIGEQCFAVSTTSDPLGPYNRYAFAIGNGFNDFPRIGLWTDQTGTQSAYHMTTNQFGEAGFDGVQLTAFDRDAMLAGNAASFVSELLPPAPVGDPFRFSLLPANLEGPPPPVGMCGLYLQVFDDETWGTGTGTDGYQFWEYCVDFDTPANSTLTEGPFVTTSEFAADLCGYQSGCVPQPSTDQRLETLSQFSMYPFNVRYFSAEGTFSGAASHSVDLGANLAGVRWAQFDIPSLAGITLSDTGTLDVGDGLYRWLPAIGIDKGGNLGMVYNRSGSGDTDFPSVYFSGRESGDAPGTLRDESLCMAGTGVQQSSHRWGAYSSVFVDPVDDCTFWVAGEYIETTGQYQWDTAICAYRFDSCGQQVTDYGDAPDPFYPTLMATDGARHTLAGGLFLGTSIDWEVDGQPTAAADGDDQNGDDEDGVVFTSALESSSMASVDVVASKAGSLDAWIDFNADGDWGDSGEQIFTSQALAAGTNSLDFTVPAGAVEGDTFARFRLSSAGGLSPSGAADDGEVEDYQVSIEVAKIPLVHRNPATGNSSVFRLINTAVVSAEYTLDFYWPNDSWVGSDLGQLAPGETLDYDMADDAPFGETYFYGKVVVSSTELIQLVPQTPDYGVISGTVFEEDGTTPLPIPSVILRRQSDELIVGNTYVLGDGTFYLGGLGIGQNHLLFAEGGATWEDQWYDGQDIQANATPITASDSVEVVMQRVGPTTLLTWDNSEKDLWWIATGPPLESTLIGGDNTGFFLGEIEFGGGVIYGADTKTANADLQLLHPATGVIFDSLALTFPPGGGYLGSLEFALGTLYGGFTSLENGLTYLSTIDLFTGQVSVVGGHGLVPRLFGLAYDESQSTMFAISGGSSAAELFEIDLVTAVPTSLGLVTVDGQGFKATALEFGDNGVLYGLAHPNETIGGHLLAIDQASALATDLGLTTVPRPVALTWGFPLIFTDGFESGDTSAWSSTVQ